MKKKSVRLNVEAAEDVPRQPNQIEQLGQKLERLGKAMQDDTSKITVLSNMAFDAGLRIRFSIDEKSAEVVDLRSELDRLIISEKECQDRLAEAQHRLSMLIALTGIVGTTWTSGENGFHLTIRRVSNPPIPLKT